MKKTSAETLTVVWKNVQDKHLHFACDASNKDGMHFIVKKTSLYNTKDNDLNIMVINSNICEGTHEKTVIAINSSFTKLNTLSKKRSFTVKLLMLEEKVQVQV